MKTPNVNVQLVFHMMKPMSNEEYQQKNMTKQMIEILK